MNDPKFKKYAVGAAPVNRRLVAPQLENERVSKDVPAVRARMQAAKSRQLLGSPLSERLAAGDQGHAPKNRLDSAEIGLGIGSAVCAVALTLGLAQGSWLLIVPAALLLTFFVFRIRRSFKLRHSPSEIASAGVAALIDPKDIAHLDAAMGKLSAEASADTIARLSGLKEQIVRCVALTASQKTDGGLSTEDHFFLRESVRRYVPDSIASCLQIPLKDRDAVVIEDGRTATVLLHSQIDMLLGKLSAIETRLTRQAGESLMQQQRFLAEKTRPPGP